MNDKQIKSLQRAALEPARVYGRRDFDSGEGLPVLHYPSLDGANWYSPNYPTWMFVDEGDNPCLKRAIDRYGVAEAPVDGSWFDFAETLFDGMRGMVFNLKAPVLREMKDGGHVPFFEIPDSDGIYCAATPVIHAIRRFGDVTLKHDDNIVRILHLNEVVGIVRVHDGKVLSDPVEDTE